MSPNSSNKSWTAKQNPAGPMLSPCWTPEWHRSRTGPQKRCAGLPYEEVIQCVAPGQPSLKARSMWFLDTQLNVFERV